MTSYKSARAQLALKDYVRLTPRNGKYTDSMRAQRNVFEDVLLGMRAATHKKEPLQPLS